MAIFAIFGIRALQASLAFVVGAAGLALAARPSASQFSSGVNLVEVYATVTDARGQLVTGLRSSDFEVLEDRTPQAVSAFAAGEFPLSVALGIDRSWSMAGERLTLAKAAARSFLNALRPSDRSMVLAVSSSTDLISPLSADRTSQFRAIGALDPWSTTALHDAIIAAVDLIQPLEGRRALVLLSDGSDRYSRATAGEALEHIRRTDVLIYPIALGETRPALFAELAVLTGGRSSHVRDARRLEGTLAEIARELRYQYLLGYAPARPIQPDQPEWRSIQVNVKRPGLRVRARDGYLAQ